MSRAKIDETDSKKIFVLSLAIRAFKSPEPFWLKRGIPKFHHFIMALSWLWQISLQQTAHLQLLESEMQGMYALQY
jgi:hypothetical protein